MRSDGARAAKGGRNVADKELEQGQSLESTDKSLYVEIAPGVYALAVLAVAAVGTTQVSASNPVPVQEV